MKHSIFAFFLAFTILVSCDSSDDSTPVEDTSANLLKSVIYTEEDGSTYTINFTYSGNKLIGYTDSYNDSATFTYSNELLVQMTEYLEGNVLDGTTTFEYDTNNRLFTETYTYPESTSQVNTYTYNANGTITLNENNENEYIYSYLDGNLINVENVGGNQDYTITYDDKNNPFKNIHQKDVFGLIGKEAFNNNILTYLNTGGAILSDEFTMSYTYNSNDYPITAIETYNPGAGNEEVSSVQYIYE